MSFADASTSLRDDFGENDPGKLFALKLLKSLIISPDPLPSLTHGFLSRYRFLSLLIRFDEEARSILFPGWQRLKLDFISHHLEHAYNICFSFSGRIDALACSIPVIMRSFRSDCGGIKA
jgi:hypothetical protein